MHSFLSLEQFCTVMEAQTWCEIFPKSTKNSKLEHGNFSNEKLNQEKHFKHVQGVLFIPSSTKIDALVMKSSGVSLSKLCV